MNGNSVHALPDYLAETARHMQHPPQRAGSTVDEYLAWLGTHCGPDGALAVETLLPLLPALEQRTALAVIEQAIAVCSD